MTEKFDLSKNRIEQQNPANFFNWILLSQTVTVSPNYRANKNSFI